MEYGNSGDLYFRLNILHRGSAVARGTTLLLARRSAGVATQMGRRIGRCRSRRYGRGYAWPRGSAKLQNVISAP